MEVKKFVVENIKGIRHVEITPEGKWVVIGGNNESGKSSLLDSVMYLFCGKGSIPVKVLRDGEEKGFVEADIEDVKIRKIKRIFEGGEKSALIVTGKKGQTLSAPQSLIEKMMGGPAITFDPTEFLRMDRAKQIETLRKLEPGLDFTDLDKAYEEIYSERTEINRALKGVKQILETTELPPPDTPTEPIGVKDLILELASAQEQNRMVEEKQRTFEELGDSYKEVMEEIRRLQEKAESIKQRGAMLREELDSLETIDLTPIREKVMKADEINRNVGLLKRRKDAEEELSQLSAKAESLTAKLQEIKDEKTERMKSANFPVEGLAFGEEGITLDGIPFDQEHLSSGQLMRVSTAIALAYNKNGVLLIRNGAMLDQKNREMVKSMAEEAGTLVLFEVVGEDQDAQIIIEDGRIK